MNIRNNYVFKGHRTLLGSRYVTYGELELPLNYDIFSKSKNGFDWGNGGSASIQLAFCMLNQLSDPEFASEYALEFANDIIKPLDNRDWVMNASDVLAWIKNNKPEILEESKEEKIMSMVRPRRTFKRNRVNVVKDVCKELSITQKNLAEILEVPEGTVSSWAVKNEIPRLGKKAIEFYIQNKKNQDVVDSYKNFVKLLQSA